MVGRETPPRTALTGGIKCQPGRPMPRKKAGRSDLQRSHHRGPRVPVIPVFREVAGSGGDTPSRQRAPSLGRMLARSLLR
jgi:hypothetical protein